MYTDTMAIDRIDECFPMQSFREGQREVLEFTVNAFNSGKDIVILECPTGSGKSAIGMTLANMVDQSYYLTITKILQDQLVEDFGDHIVELKGRNAYPCTFWERRGQIMVDRFLMKQADLDKNSVEHATCADGFCRTKFNAKKNPNGKQRKVSSCSQCFLSSDKKKGDLLELPDGMAYSACPYYEKVEQAIRSPRVVMNFSSFLFQTYMTKRFENPRDLLIIDEAHNIEPQLLDFVSFKINDLQLQKHGVFIPELETPQEYAVWFEDAKIHETIMLIREEALEASNSWLVDDMERLLKKYKMFMDQMTSEGNEWVSEYEEKTQGGGKNGVSYRSVTLRPVFATNFVYPLLFQYASKIVMMSATILDIGVICKSLGISRDRVAAYRMKNRFPKENRPIHLEMVAKMTGGKDRMIDWAPPLVDAVNRLCKQYQGKRGIIHTHNYTILDHLLSRCDPAVKKRFTTQREFPDKQELLVEHGRRSDSIIVAPAMHEGLDLSGDLSRFQIICKVPFPNCFDDLQLARRVEIDRKYYNWLVALKLVQSYGRSIRSEDDYADTYILDESIDKFIQQNKSLLPSWFLEAIV